MNIVINPDVVASPEFIRNQIKQQIESRGMIIHDNYNGYVVCAAEPIRIENIKGGFFFMNTYHRWWWKIIYKMHLKPIVAGKFELSIELPNSIEAMDVVRAFLDGLEVRLKESLGNNDELKESIDVTFVRIPPPDPYRTDNIPDDTYY